MTLNRIKPKTERMTKILLTALTLFIIFSSQATTWDEPWQKEIIQQSEYFVFGKVLTANDSVVTIEIENSVGESLSGTITLDGFFMLDICSWSSGHGPEFHFGEGDEGYFFLKKGENGNYQIPTPTSGFDRVVDDKIHATYRHTYHQAAIPLEAYELTYTEIWNKYHSNTFDKEKILEYINEQLSLDPAGFEEDEIDLFFKQHAALESVYLLDLEFDFETLEKFASCDNFHSRISAIRAMNGQDKEKVSSFLLDYLVDKKMDEFSKVIAIWTLWKIEDAKIQSKLWKLRKKLSDDDNGFGGNIMDPRVCTHFPSPKNAVINLKGSEARAKAIYNY